MIVVFNGFEELSKITERLKTTEFIRINVSYRLIKEKSKWLAINLGIKESTSKYIRVLDADTKLKNNALFRAYSLFEENSKVQAVGGRIKVVPSKNSVLSLLQIIEYSRSFNIGRVILHKLNASMLISGAFGLFDRQALIDSSLFSSDTVGEDMEICLRIIKKFGNGSIVYCRDAIGYKKTPSSIKESSFKKIDGKEDY